MRKRTTLVLLFLLTLLGMLAQIAPFVLHPVPTAQTVAAVNLPAHYPRDYSAADFARAEALDQALFWGDLAATVTTAFALAALLLCEIPEKVGAVSSPPVRAWMTRLLFLAAVYLFLCAVGLPFRWCRFLHHRAFGLSPLTDIGWLKIFLLGLPVPLVLFTLKYLLVICTLPLFKRHWWIAASLGVFLVFDVTPEIVSRTYPADPVETLRALDAGPLHDSMKSMLRKAGLDLPLMVVDESRRSKTGNLCLTGRVGREYVLLTDTFAQEYSPEEVSLALAHELGHFQRRTVSLLIHKSCGLLISLLSFGLAFLLSGRRALPITSAPRAVVLVLFCGLLVSHALAPFTLAISRHEERAADRYALRLAGAGHGEAYARLLVRVAQQEVAPLDLPPWRYYLCASHPTFLERIVEARR